MEQSDLGVHCRPGSGGTSWSSLILVYTFCMDVCHNMLCYVMLCYVMLCYVMLCSVSENLGKFQ